MGTYAEAIATVSISRATRTPSVAGFGTPLVAGYHTKYLARVRAYADLTELVADGFTPYDPIYRAVAAAFAQTPSPTSVKVGRRALPYTQVVHLTPGTPVASEVFSVDLDGLEATYTADATPTVAEVCTGLAAAINALGDVDAIVATGASTADTQTLTGASLDGATGNAVMAVPRYITLTFSSHADWDATTATLTGLDGNGNAQSESIAIPNGGNATATSTKRYLRVTSLAIPAQSGTGGTFTAGVSAPVTAVGSSGTHVVCTAAAGEFHSYAPTANVGLSDETTNPGLATDLGAILTADSDWYGLLLDSQSSAEILAAATWTETNKKLFVWQSSDSDALDGSVVDDVFSATQDAGYVRSAGAYYPALGTNWIAAAWMGEEFPKTEGASVWMFKTLAGITVYELTSAQRLALEAKGGNHYLDAGGVSITGPGNSASGEWLDVVRDLDWLTARLKERALGVFVTNDKVPFTDGGISLVVAAVRAQLNEAVDKTVLAPGFTLTAPLASSVSTANKRARRLPDVTFGAELAGAIQGVNITGRVSV